MSEKSILIKGWTHREPSEKDGRLNVISRLCVAPLETFIWGIKDGKYFSERHIIEGFEDYFFDYITEEEFQRVLDEEIRICRENGGEEIAEKLEKYRK